MLSKKERLTTKEFSRFFASGQRRHGRYLQLIFSPHHTFHGSAVVGKKIFKHAVRRNRIRRQLYALLYRFSNNNSLSGVFILVAKPTVREATFADLKADVEQLIARVA